MYPLWVLLALLRPVVAVAPSFNVHNDILAYPQYEVVYSESYISTTDAKALLAKTRLLRDQDANLHPTRDTRELQTQLKRDEADAVPSSNATYLRMISDGVPHLCTIPTVVSPPLDDSNTVSKEEQQQELVRASQHGWELLKDLQGDCLYFAAGYWMYSFCYNQGIKQFHPLPPSEGNPSFTTEDDGVQSYLLGSFSHPENDGKQQEGDGGKAQGKAVRTTSQLQRRGDTQFLVRQLGGGTICDLTGQARRIEVQFYCNPDTSDRINSIKETASCVYLMVIHTSRLCKDVAFLPPQPDEPNYITCREVIPEAHIKAWKAMKASEAEELLRQRPKEVKGPVTIGGVRVGAKSLVGGTPDTTIKASNIVLYTSKDGKEVGEFVVTLAKSDGKMVSVVTNSQIEKDGLPKRKEVDKWVEGVEKLARQQGEETPWRLDLYKTSQGLKFQAVIGSSKREKSDETKGEEKAADQGTMEDTAAGSEKGAPDEGLHNEEGTEPGSDEELKS